jgi:hypothetical protein
MGKPIVLGSEVLFDDGVDVTRNQVTKLKGNEATITNLTGKKKVVPLATLSLARGRKQFS